MNPAALELEVVWPAIPARIKERDLQSTVRVNRREVDALVTIAAAASPREILQGVITPMLTGQDMF